jgi:Beta protein
VFDHKHYVPILRWKEAERLALRELQEEIRSRVTPLVQLVPESIRTGKRTPTVEHALQRIAGDMRQCWGTSRLLVDLLRLDPLLRVEADTHPLVYLARHAGAISSFIVPVTGLNRGAAYQAAVRQVATAHGKGACLRLFGRDLVSSSLHVDVERLLSQIRVGPEEVDLILDLECHDATYPAFDRLASLLPNLRHWRSLTVASGAFPPDLTQWKTPGAYPVPRLDWLAWLGEIQLTENMIRKPAFSDYAIYHPTYRPPAGFPNFTASIRYTSDDEWIVMRGEGVHNEGGAGFAQWPANATLLCGRPEFQRCGARFSAGDNYIAQEAGNYAHPGNASTWLQAGFNHHITFVVRQVASLFAT